MQLDFYKDIENLKINYNKFFNSWFKIFDKILFKILEPETGLLIMNKRDVTEG